MHHPRDPGSPNLRMVSWHLNTLRFVSVMGSTPNHHPLTFGDWTPRVGSGTWDINRSSWKEKWQFPRSMQRNRSVTPFSFFFMTAKNQRFPIDSLRFSTNKGPPIAGLNGPWIASLGDHALPLESRTETNRNCHISIQQKDMPVAIPVPLDKKGGGVLYWNSILRTKKAGENLMERTHYWTKTKNLSIPKQAKKQWLSPTPELPLNDLRSVLWLSSSCRVF